MTKLPTGFDPYRKWLGIPSKRRPPTYYDLLALSLDEDDPDVIRSASEQRQSFVQAQRGKAPEKIINSILYQLQEAELTLLDPELRREYDKKLHLFEKRKKQRRVQPNAERSRPESRPGKTVGEGNEIVRTFIGIMLVLGIGCGLMAWYSFQLPWERPLPKTQASQTGRAPATTTQQMTNPHDTRNVAAERSSSDSSKDDHSTVSKASIESVFLNTLPLIDQYSIWGWLSIHGEVLLGGHSGESLIRKPLLFEGEESAHGIYLHATGHERKGCVTFDLGGRFKKLMAEPFIPVAVAHQGDPRNPLVFEVVGDGRLLWTSRPLDRKGESTECAVSVSGVNHLRLQIACPAPTNWCLGAWHNPRLLPNDVQKDSDALAPPMPQNSKAPRSNDATAQRNLALYVLRCGGTVYVSPPNVEKEAAESRDEHIKRVEDVPDEDFVVKEISFHGQSEISSFHVKQLVDATQLERLWLSGTAVNDDAMTSVGQLANLKVLYLGGVAVTDRGMIPIGKLENLRLLGLHATKVTDEGISHLVGLKNLESIRIRDTQITEAAIERHLPWAVAPK